MEKHLILDVETSREIAENDVSASEGEKVQALVRELYNDGEPVGERIERLKSVMNDEEGVEEAISLMFDAELRLQSQAPYERSLNSIIHRYVVGVGDVPQARAERALAEAKSEGMEVSLWLADDGESVEDVLRKQWLSDEYTN